MPAGEHPTLRTLVDDVLDAQHQLLQAFHAATPLPEWAGLSLTLHQLSALFVLFQRGPLPTGQLGAQLGLRKPAATLLVDALVRHGLVVRREDERDRRRTVVQLSERGHTLINDHYTGTRQQFVDWLAQLVPEDLACLARGMQALATVARSAAENPATTVVSGCRAPGRDLSREIRPTSGSSTEVPVGRISGSAIRQVSA